MANARNTDFTLVDYTKEINKFPKVWDLISGMGLFSPHNIQTTVAQIEFVQEKVADIAARQRGGERNYVNSEDAETVNLSVPFYPLDKSIRAADIQNFREYGTGNTEKTVMQEVARSMNRVRKSHSQLREKLMANAIQGVGLNAKGVGKSVDYYAEFGQTKVSLDVELTSADVDPSVTAETARRSIIKLAQDDKGSHASYYTIAICGEKYFSNLIANINIEEAYKYFSSEQDPLRRRLGMNDEGDSVRVFRYKGVTYIEDLSGNFPENKAYMFPQGMEEMFRTYYSPADDMDYANTKGQELYLWFKEDRFNRLAKVESESSMLCVNTRPELVIELVDTSA
ncbi:major capsid protein E [Vibrio phage 1.101.O._10N.261.45.C6]|nr:major capsid protein E [Vibrio phage 1.101.O._10N.261.45.C6]